MHHELERIIDEHKTAISDIKKDFGEANIPRPQVDINYLRELSRGDRDIENLFDEMMQSFYRYTEILCRYAEFDYKKNNEELTGEEQREEERNLDETRKIIHDTAIDNVIILARALEKAGKDNKWLEKLGDPKNRIRYGQFALTATYQELIKEKEDKSE